MKSLYSRFFAADPGRLHFAAHSHHPWPDVSRQAQIEAWDDAARLADLKWDHIFGSVIPEAQAHIATALDLPAPGQIAFAPNTHDFVLRLLSCLPADRRVRITTTDSEFLSFSRQIARLEEESAVEVTRVPVEPFDTFTARFVEAVSDPLNDLVFFSQVFFNSGFVVKDLEAIAAAAPPRALVAIDGYHGFFALETSLRAVADRAFFMAGGYKYAQSGEGVCFLAVPRDFRGRPRNTGWFAGFGSLGEGDVTRVGFTNDGFRMMGATFDPVGLYRFNSVARLYASGQISVGGVDRHVKALQEHFLDGLGQKPGASLSPSDLIAPAEGIAGLGHFLTFRRADAGLIQKRLAEGNVIVDHRGDRLRFGFGAYHVQTDVDSLLAHL